MYSDEKGVRCWRSFDELTYIETGNHGGSRRNLHTTRIYRTPTSHYIYMVTGSQSQRKSWGAWRDFTFNYYLKVNSDYSTVDMDIFPIGNYLISQGDYGTGSDFIFRDGNGRVGISQLLGPMSTLGDINVYFDTYYSLKRNAADTGNLILNHNELNGLWNIECRSVWYPWND